MKKTIKKVVILTLCAMLLFQNGVVEINAQTNDSYFDSEEIIGAAESNEQIQTRANLLSNMLVVDFVATSSSIIVEFNNIGLDSIDTVSGTVTINNVSKNITTFRARPGITKITVPFDMKKCHETIYVKVVAQDGGDSVGSSTIKGSRTLPNKYLLIWHPGTFSNAATSLDYHFKKHGPRLGITNIEKYVINAIAFRNNLSGATSSVVNGGTSNVKRWKKLGKFIDICGDKNTGLIISYGKQ